MTALSRTIRIARPLSYLTTLALVGYPLAMIVIALSGYLSEAQLRANFNTIAVSEQITPAVWVILGAIAAVSVALVMVALWNMRALLLLYVTGDVLGPNAAQRIRRIGHCLLALAIWGTIAHTLEVAALTWNNPVGTRALSVAFSNTDLFLFLAAGLMTVIGWAMSEAANVAAENRGFV